VKARIQIGGWVCSRQARFWHIPAGNCEEVGLQTINSIHECEAVARLLKVSDTVAVTQMSPWGGRGCYYATMLITGRKNFLAFFPGSGGNWSGTWSGTNNSLSYVQLCMPAHSATTPEDSLNSSTLAAERSSHEQASNNSSGQIASRIDVGPVLYIGPLLYSSCLVSIGAVGVTVVWNWKLLRSAGSQVLSFARRILRVFACSRSHSDSSALEALVASTLQRRRATCARFAAAVYVTTHLFWLASLTLEPASPCGGSGPIAQVQIVMVMCGHLGQILVASAFLVLSAKETCNIRCMVRAFAVAAFVLHFAEDAMLEGVPMLWRHRPWLELLWRILVGVSLDVPSMAGWVGLRSAASVFLYSISVPDNMIVIRLAETCTELWSIDKMEKTVKDLWLVFHGVSRFGFMDSDANVVLANMQALLTFFASESTSLSTFATTEAFQALALILCLAMVGHALAEEARSTARLQSSRSAAEAVSQILDRLCDAVVTIDSHHVIMKSAPRFRGLLGISASAQLEGVDIRSRMPSEDAETLERHLAGLACPSEPIALSLVDSLSIPVRCEFFMAEFRSDGLERNVVVGINEVGERARETDVHAADVASDFPGLPPLLEHVPLQRHISSATEYSTSSAGLSSDSDLGSCLSTEDLMFEFKYRNGEIVAASSGFSTMFGSDCCVGAHVMELMSVEERKVFSEWLREASSRVACLPLPQEVVSEPLCFRVKSYKRKPPPDGGARKSRSKSRKQWAKLIVTFRPQVDGQAVSDYVLLAEVKLESRPRTQAAVQPETGFLSCEAVHRDLLGGQNLGRCVVGL